MVEIDKEHATLWIKPRFELARQSAVEVCGRDELWPFPVEHIKMKLHLKPSADFF
jgi:hypothetical protein